MLKNLSPKPGSYIAPTRLERFGNPATLRHPRRPHRYRRPNRDPPRTSPPSLLPRSTLALLLSGCGRLLQATPPLPQGGSSATMMPARRKATLMAAQAILDIPREKVWKSLHRLRGGWTIWGQGCRQACQRRAG